MNDLEGLEELLEKNSEEFSEDDINKLKANFKNLNEEKTVTKWFKRCWRI